MQFVREQAGVVVFGMGWQHRIDDACQFMSGGFDGLLRTMLCLDPTVVCPSALLPW